MPSKNLKNSTLEKTESEINSEKEAENARAKNFEDVFKLLLEDTLKDQKSLEGKIVKGRIVAIDHDAIVVNVSSKSEGRIPLKEFGETE